MFLVLPAPLKAEPAAEPALIPPKEHDHQTNPTTPCSCTAEDSSQHHAAVPVVLSNLELRQETSSKQSRKKAGHEAVNLSGAVQWFMEGFRWLLPKFLPVVAGP